MSSTNVSPDTSVLLWLQIGEFAIAVVVLTVLSLLERNSKGKRPGLLEPLNFLQDDSLSLVYGAAFGCTAYEIVSALTNMDSFTNNLNISRLVKPWIRVLIWLLIALLTSLKIYPVFAAIRCSKLLVDPLIGFFYTGYESITVQRGTKRHVDRLPGLFYLFFIGFYLIWSSNIMRLFSLFRSGVFTYRLYLTITAYRGSEAVIVAYIPTLVCYAVLLGYFLYKGISHMIILIRHDVTDFNKVTHRCASSHQKTYVQWLLRKPDQKFKTSDTGIKRSLDDYKYEVKLKLGLTSHLRASPRVIVTFIVAAVALFEIGIAEVAVYVQLSPSTTLPQLLPVSANTTISRYVTTFLTVMDAGYYISFSISSIFMAVYICTLFLNYRKDLEKMQKGDYSFLPMKLRKSLNDNIVAASLRYAGMQIAYLVWCYVLCTFILWVGCFLVAYIVILPLTGDVPLMFFEPVPLFIPVIIVNYTFRKVQVILSRKVFLQDYDVTIPGKTITQKALALDNIKMFNILTFFMFFFHAIIGFISCLSRILVALAIGLVSLARIDRCMLPRGYEKLDKGYSTYVGMLMVELYHRNPILTVFCDELLAVTANKGCMSVLLEPVVSNQKQETTKQKYTRNCRRWQKAYTLLKNPSIRKIPFNNIECSIEQVELHVKC